MYVQLERGHSMIGEIGSLNIQYGRAGAKKVVTCDRPAITNSVSGAIGLSDGQTADNTPAHYPIPFV